MSSSNNNNKNDQEQDNDQKQDKDKQQQDKDQQHTLTQTEQAIIELMKKQAIIDNNKPNIAKRVDEFPSDSTAEGSKKKHTFWDTQPMPFDNMISFEQMNMKKDKKTMSISSDNNDDNNSNNNNNKDDIDDGPIIQNKTKDEIRNIPYNMPSGFNWSEINILNNDERKELYDLLANNYVEDDDCLFRFDYSENFLLWALTPPNWSKDLLLGVRASKTNKLVAFISGIPTKIRVHNKKVNMVEINFLCVHKKLRSKRLAPVLIKEITRRVNYNLGRFQAVYTAGVVLPVPISSARYHHRSLNPKKLVDVGFSRLQPRQTMARMIKLYKLPTTVQCTNIREMNENDIEGVHIILNKYLSKFKLCVDFTLDEIKHWLLPRDGVINSYVITNPNNNENNEVTDFCSFYHLPSSILGQDANSDNATLYAAYSFYNVANTVSWYDLMKDCLILAKNKCNSDVFNALNLMDNDEFLSSLKFGLGDGNLQYYVYNWSCPTITNKEIGLVLL